jgi:hypothetical protein
MVDAFMFLFVLEVVLKDIDVLYRMLKRNCNFFNLKF